MTPEPREQPNGAPAAPKPRIVFEYDPATGGCGWRQEGAFPLPLLVNILEVASLTYKSQQLQSVQAQQKPGLVLPSGPLPPAPRW